MSKSKLDVVEPKVTFIQKVIGSDTYLVMADSSVEIEDEFAGLYYTTSSVNNVVLMPPYPPKTLLHLVSHNNILSQCIEAMEVNIDGTGYDFVPVDEKSNEIDEAEKQILESFFAEPYPGKTFLQIRRKLRRELESIGYAFLEVLRNMAGEIVGLRNVESSTIRFVKLDAPVLVKRAVIRNGKEVELQLYERERRFVQRVGAKNIYYKEFGASRHLDKFTGEWESSTNSIPIENRATELLYFNVNPDTQSPYGIPRWINQLPSVIGSRKAEEQNLEFLDAGGMPPAIIFVQGGVLARDASEQLRMYLSGKNKNRARAVVVEAQSSSGSLESPGTVQVRVERFGAEQAKDSMYSNYDKITEEHVRTGFRLPPLFIGRSQDYSYATAAVSYMIAEEQVFRPERLEFDDIINATIVKGLGVKTLRLKSRPITLKTVDDKLKALQLIAQTVNPEDLVKEINVIAGTSLTVAQQPEQPQMGPQEQNATEQPQAEAPQQGEQKTAKVERNIVALAHDWGAINGLIVSKSEYSDEDKQRIEEEVASLRGEDLALFNEIVSVYTLGGVGKDLVTITESCCSSI